MSLMTSLPDLADIRFSEEEYRDRVKRFRAQLQDQGVDVYLCTMPEQMNYLTGYDPLALYLHEQITMNVHTGQLALLSHKAESEIARVTCCLQDRRAWTHGEDPVERTIEMLREFGLSGGATLGLELQSYYLNVATVWRIQEAVPGIRLVDVTELGQELRMLKSPAEIAYLRAAAGYADAGMFAAAEAIRPGVRENDVLAAIQQATTTAGSEYPSLPMIVGSGPRSGLFHVAPTQRVIESGDPVMIEITGVHARYSSNIVRTLVAGKASSELKALREVVVDSFWAGFELIKPGAPVSAVDRATREVRSNYLDHVIARAGFAMELAYPPAFAGTPSIEPGSEHVFLPGMVVSLEPSIAMYKGVTVIFGCNMLVTEGGAEILNQFPHDLFEIPA